MWFGSFNANTSGSFSNQDSVNFQRVPKNPLNSGCKPLIVTRDETLGGGSGKSVLVDKFLK
jgi:hypothetical protein